MPMDFMLTQILSTEHELRDGPSGAPSYGYDVTIGDDCWIGGQVTILGGVHIGDGCVIGAGSLITKVSNSSISAPSFY